MRCNLANAPLRRTSRNGHHADATRRGVTLLEAILVILILSGAAVASSFVLDGNWVSDRVVKDLTIEVAQTVDAARNTAITNRCNVHVRRIRVNGFESLEISQDAGPHRGSQQHTIPLGDDLTIRARPSEIEFTANGTARRAATWIVTQGRVSGQIVVTPSTGRVTMQLP